MLICHRFRADSGDESASSDYPKYACNDAARYGTCGCSNRSEDVFETSHPATHSAPTYVIDGIVHYAVANIPGAVPYTFYAGF